MASRFEPLPSRSGGRRRTAKVSSGAANFKWGSYSLTLKKREVQSATGGGSVVLPAISAAGFVGGFAACFTSSCVGYTVSGAGTPDVNGCYSEEKFSPSGTAGRRRRS